MAPNLIRGYQAQVYHRHVHNAVKVFMKVAHNLVTEVKLENLNVELPCLLRKSSSENVPGILMGLQDCLIL